MTESSILYKRLFNPRSIAVIGAYNTQRWLLVLLCFLFLYYPVEAFGGIANPDQPQNEFTFIVLGDSQFNNPQLFNRIVEEAAQLYPSFVIQVGDLINGYINDPEAAREEWRRFKSQIEPLKGIPYFPVPGNHDVLDGDRKPGLAPIFKEVWGNLYYSFDYKNAHFIVLNTDDQESADISTKQMEWLEGDLRKNRDRDHIFVFFHRPIESLKVKESLYALFKRYTVRAVFYGHNHHYHYFVKDHSPYIMTNASGNMATNLSEAGNFHHFIFATVRDDVFRYGVIKAGSVLPPDIVDPKDNSNVFGLKRDLLMEEYVTPQELTQTDQGYPVTLRLNNPTDQELWIFLEWDLPDRRWHVLPKKGTRLVLIPGAEKHLITFTLCRENDVRPEGWPSCLIRTEYLTQKGDWVTISHEFKIQEK